MDPYRTTYRCNPELNTKCRKNNCFINGGPCISTANIEFAQQPVEKVTLTFPMTHDEAKELGFMEEEDVRE